MNRRLREIRIIPIALFAIGCLFALKATGLWFEGGYTLGQRLTRGETTMTVVTIPASPSTPLRSPTTPLEPAVSTRQPGQRSWAQEMFNYPDITGSVSKPQADPREEKVIVTGAAAAKEPPKNPPKEPEKKDAKEPAKPEAGKADPAKPGDKPVDLAARPEGRMVSSSERAILERLLERRQELDARARELELRENLLKAAEKNLEEKLGAMKAQEGPNNQRKDEADQARFKGLITMYETMKPKDAAKIFDRLDMKVLAEVAGKINPRRMSEILSQMSPEAAERLTVEFASRNDPDKGPKPADLPKIEGRPGN